VKYDIEIDMRGGNENRYAKIKQREDGRTTISVFWDFFLAPLCFLMLRTNIPQSTVPGTHFWGEEESIVVALYY
jgi:hypothetical protein